MRSIFDTKSRINSFNGKSESIGNFKNTKDSKKKRENEFRGFGAELCKFPSPVFFIFVEVFPIAMVIVGHDNESEEREQQTQASQTQRPSLQKILSLPPPKDPGGPPRRRGLVLDVTGKGEPSTAGATHPCSSSDRW
ncbi:hypothetical protein U1Q18_036159 [Sarracenia purpurea var. burkii]